MSTRQTRRRDELPETGGGQSAATRDVSTRWLRALAERASGGVLFEDETATVVYANTNACALLGAASPDALMGKPAAALIGALVEDSEAFVSHMREALRDGQAVEAEELVARDGTILLLDVNRVDDAGSLWQLEDVTEQRQLDRAQSARDVYLTSILNQAPVLLFMLDTHGKLTSIEGHPPTLPDQRRPGLVGQSMFDVLRDMSGEHISSHIRRALNGEAVSETIEIADVVFDLRMMPTHNEAGQVTGVVGVASDVTPQKRVEEALRRQNVYLGALHEMTLALINHLDLGHMLQTTVERAAALLNTEHACIYLVDADAQRMVMRFGSGVFRQRLGFSVGKGDAATGQVWQTGQPIVVEDYEAWAGRSTNFKEDLLRAVACVPLKSGVDVVGVLCVAHLESGPTFNEQEVVFLRQFAELAAVALDNARLYGISQAQVQELKGLTSQLSELEQLKTQMLRVAGHDLRGPLGIVSAYLSLVQDDLGADAERFAIYFEPIHRSIHRMMRMTDDLLSLERIRQNQEKTRQVMSLRETVARAVVDNRDQAEAKALEMRLEAGESDPLIVADPVQVYEAVNNLIGNAIKYTPKGGQVIVRLWCTDATAMLDVCDNGLGVPSEYHDRLFEPFYRVKTEETRSIEGTGLGLYLVKTIVEQHGGAMRFESIHQKGSTFGFSLPLAETLYSDSDPV